MVSDETRRKMSEAAKRRAADPEYKKAMSERTKAQMARPGAKEKLSETTKKQMADPEKKKAMQDAQFQALQSPEVRAKMSESAKKKYADPEKGKAARDAVKEAMKRPEVRQKMSESANKRWKDPEQRKATSESSKAQMSDPEMRANAIKAAKDYWTPELRDRKSEQMKQIFSETDLAERIIQSASVSKKYTHTDIEIIVAKFLQALGVEYETQKLIGRYAVDFYIPSKHLVIECDGDYWHSKPEIQKRDKEKNIYLASKGYSLLRVLGSRILARDLKCIEDAVLDKET